MYQLGRCYIPSLGMRGTFFGMQNANLFREGLIEVHINFKASYEQLLLAKQLRSPHFLAIVNLYTFLKPRPVPGLELPIWGPLKIKC